jgi:hypothetical protein
MACFEPHTIQRPSNSVSHRRNKEIFDHISQPTNTTRKQSGYRIKQPATRQTKTKMAVALRPHNRERRRGITAHNSIIYSVCRRIITGWFLRTNVNPRHIYLLLHCRVDCKFATENKKILNCCLATACLQCLSLTTAVSFGFTILAFSKHEQSDKHNCGTCEFHMGKSF